MELWSDAGVRAASVLFAGSSEPALSHLRTDEGDRWDFPEPVSHGGCWSRIAARLGISPEVLQSAADRARANGTRAQAELMVAGLVDEEALYNAIAEELGLPFTASIDPADLIVRDRDLPGLLTRAGGALVAKAEAGENAADILISPDISAVNELEDLIRGNPAAARRLRIISRRRLREALIRWGEPQLARAAKDALFDSYPYLSGRTVLNAWQGFAVGAGVILLPVALALAPSATLLILHCFFSLFFFACVALRLAAWQTARPPALQPFRSVKATELPIYTVLVALHREAEIVPELLVALGRLVWPRSKLEIKLVCEADDHATLQAVAAQQLRSYMEVIKVPRLGPQTKPKALNYALQIVSGEFVALYDAEDRPHPLQLLEAWQRFRDADEKLACVQAPLVVSNGHRGLLPRMFAFEYAALFRGLLPWLSRKGLIIPLGGTSNHFRRSALEEVIGWDPYNVTEDADLGLRLHRFGYRTETISRPTYEDAPEDLMIWLRQRTRWFKGWMQTWLVHMRNPFQLLSELGPMSFVICQVLFFGMVASALVHPLLIFTIVAIVSTFAFADTLSVPAVVLLVLDTINLGCGYLAFLLLGGSTLLPQERGRFWQVNLWTPAYWLLMSAAAWRSAWQIYRAPHLWEKTPHQRHRQTRQGGTRTANPAEFLLRQYPSGSPAQLQ